MNDVIESRGPGLSANGGTGDDRLGSWSVAAGILNGGGGRDTLLGGMNRDTLVDGDVTGAADADVLSGRENGAIVSYAERTAPVRVDLSDDSGDDRIVGLAGDDVLGGGAGRDVLYGGDGLDVLDGGVALRGRVRLRAAGGTCSAVPPCPADAVTRRPGQPYASVCL